MSFKACIPLEERKLNQVDIFKKKIEEIQENCNHDFRLVLEPKLQESLVSGVFVGSVGGLTKVGFSDTEMTLVCMNCSKEKKIYINHTCLRCLGKMEKEGWCLGAGSRKKYFGEEYSYYSIQLFRCVSCGFTVASDEWDQ